MGSQMTACSKERRRYGVGSRSGAYVAELPGIWAMNRRQKQLLMEDLKHETSHYSSYYQQQINQCQEWKNRPGPFAAELAVARLIDRKLDLLNDKLKLEKLLVAGKFS